MQCARHPDVEADGTCDRCGDFVCRGCRHPQYPELCGRCGDRLPRGIPWEDRRYGNLPWRFVLTVRDVLWRPKVAFPGPARVGPGLAFALTCFVLGLGPFAAIVVYLGPAPDLGGVGSALLGSVVVVAVATTVLLTAQSVSFGAGLLMVGRRHGVMRFGLRAASYASAIWWIGFFVGAAATLSVEMPTAGWIAILAVWAVLTGRLFVHAGRGLGLPTGSAVLASLGPTITCTVPVALLAYERLVPLAA